MQDDLTFVSVLRLFWRHRFMILISCVAVGLLSIIASLRLDDYYTSETTFVPAGQDNFKPEKLFGEGVQYFYGSREDADRLLSVAQSADIKNALIDSFDLMEVYEIDTSHPKAQLKVLEEISGLMTVSKTKYGAISIAVEDKDPLLASQIANAGRELTADRMKRIVQSQLDLTISTLEKDLEFKSKLIRELSDSLSAMRDVYGIYDTHGQAEILATILSETESKLNREKERYNQLKNSSLIPRDTLKLLEANVRALEKQYTSLVNPSSDSRINLSRYNQGNSLVKSTEQKLNIERTQSGYQQLKLSQYYSARNADISTIFLLDEAKPALQKSRPRRSILVMGATFLGFVTCLFLILVADRFRQIEWKS